MTNELVRSKDVAGVKVYELTTAQVLEWSMNRAEEINKLPKDDTEDQPPEVRANGLFEAMYDISPAELRLCCHFGSDEEVFAKIPSGKLPDVIKQAKELNKDFFDRKTNLLSATASQLESSSNSLELVS